MIQVQVLKKKTMDEILNGTAWGRMCQFFKTYYPYNMLIAKAFQQGSHAE